MAGRAKGRAPPPGAPTPRPPSKGAAVKGAAIGGAGRAEAALPSAIPCAACPQGCSVVSLLLIRGEKSPGRGSAGPLGAPPKVTLAGLSFVRGALPPVPLDAALSGTAKPRRQPPRFLGDHSVPLQLEPKAAGRSEPPKLDVHLRGDFDDTRSWKSGVSGTATTPIRVRMNAGCSRENSVSLCSNH